MERIVAFVLLVRHPQDPNQEYANVWLNNKLDILHTNGSVVNAIHRAINNGDDIFIQRMSYLPISDTVVIQSVEIYATDISQISLDEFHVNIRHLSDMHAAPFGRSFGNAFYNT